MIKKSEFEQELNRVEKELEQLTASYHELLNNNDLKAAEALQPTIDALQNYLIYLKDQK